MQLDVKGAIISCLLVSAVGFCDYELNADSAHGIYNWSETEVGDVVNLSCFYDNQDETTNSNTAGVSRLCLGHRNWSEIDIGECISFVVFGFQQVSIAVSLVIVCLCYVRYRPRFCAHSMFRGK